MKHIWDEEVCSVRFWQETVVLFLGQVVWGWEEKALCPMEFELCFITCDTFEQPKIYVFMFCIICCGGDQNLTDVSRTGCTRYGWVRQLDSSPSTHRWSVEVYVSQLPHQEATVVFGYIEVPCERYAPNIYIQVHTHISIQDTKLETGGGELRTTGTGPHTTLDLTHVHLTDPRG